MIGKVLNQSMVVILLLCIGLKVQAQAQDSSPNWDNQMYFSNKVAWANKEDFRQSAEFQTRYIDNLGTLQTWHLEYVLTYLLNENIEIVPDFRFTRTSQNIEIRPGLGLIYKNLYDKSQIVHQFKWQWDYSNSGYSSHGLRYAVFYNRKLSEKILGAVLAGGLYEIGADFNGFIGLRAGAQISYIFDKVHSLNFGYFYGAISTMQPVNDDFDNVGIVSFQLILNITKEYKYVPAKYISF